MKFRHESRHRSLEDPGIAWYSLTRWMNSSWSGGRRCVEREAPGGVRAAHEAECKAKAEGATEGKNLFL